MSEADAIKNTDGPPRGKRSRGERILIPSVQEGADGGVDIIAGKGILVSWGFKNPFVPAAFYLSRIHTPVSGHLLISQFLHRARLQRIFHSSCIVRISAHTCA